MFYVYDQEVGMEDLHKLLAIGERMDRATDKVGDVSTT